MVSVFVSGNKVLEMPAKKKSDFDGKDIVGKAFILFLLLLIVVIVSS